MGSTFLAAVTAWADDRDPTFDIPSQTLGSALIEFSEQADVQVVVASNATAGIRAPRVTGQFSAREALTALLANSGLQFQAVGEKTFALAQAAPAAAPRPTVAVPKTDVQKSADPPAQVVPKGEQTTEVRREEIVVTGSRLRGAGDDGPAPVTTLSREQIDQLGVTSTADLISYLPQQSFGFQQNTFASAKSVQLRGLGLGTTLVLINGRRVVTSALQGARNFFDLNTIPLAAVERVEVLTNSASAVYGADAVGGVINIILKQQVDRPAVSMYVGAADGGDEERRATISLGGNGQRFRGSLTLDAFDQTALLGSERDRYANQDFRRFGGVDRRTLFANPGNISSSTSANLPGLPSRIAAVPEGSTGVGLTPASFIETAGQSNLESTARYYAIMPDVTRYSAIASAEAKLGDALDLFGEVMFVDGETTSPSTPPILAAKTVPATNAFNPFGVPVVVNYLLTGAGPSRDEYEASTLRWTTGLKGDAGTGWDWELSVLGIDEDSTGRTLNGLDGARVDAALASSDPALALNVFQDGPGGTESLLRSLVATPVVNSYSSDAIQGTAFVRGSPFATGAGNVEIVVGAEARSEKMHFESRPSIILSPDRDSASGFAEVRLPLFGGGRRVRAIDRLALTVAGRYDEYSDAGSTFNPQYGIEWYPHRQLLLRGSYGTSFRAPSLFELYQPAVARPTVVVDPHRGGAPSPITLLTGGNTELEPEEAEALTMGFVFRFDERTGSSVSASYWSVHQDQRVQRLTNSLILINESLFPERVIRAAPTPEDIAAGFPGALVSIDSTSVNFGKVDTSGVDLAVSGTIATRFGDFSPAVAATWVEKYDAADFPNTPVVERVGVANVQGTIPEWRGTASLAWTRGGIGLSAVARYVSAYDDANTSNVRTGRKVDAQVLLDLQASLDLSRIWSEALKWPQGLTLRGGLINALDQEPRFSEVSALGLDPRQADVRQRFAYLSLAATF